MDAALRSRPHLPFPVGALPRPQVQRTLYAVLALAALLTVILASMPLQGPGHPAGAPSASPVPFYTSVGPTVDASGSSTFTTAASGHSTAIAVTAHDVVYAVLSYQTTTRTVTNIQDTSGDTFTLLGSASNSGHVAVFVYYSNNVVGRATNAVFFNISGTATGVIGEVAVKGQNLTSSQNGVGAGTTGSNLTLTDILTGANAPTINNDLVFIAGAATSNPATAAKNGNAKVYGTPSGTTDVQAVYDIAQATAAGITNQIGIASTQNWSAISWATRPALLPNTVTGLTSSSPTVTTLSLSWTNPTPNNGISNNTIYQWSASLTCTGAYSLSISTSGAATSKTVTGLSGATAYSFRVGAWNASGQSIPLSSCVTGITVPAVPTALTISSPTVSGLTLSWTNPSGTLVNVTKAKNGGTGGCTSPWTVTGIGSVVTSTTFSFLTSASTYCVGVEVWSSGGASGWVFTNGTTLPGTVTGLAVSSQTATSISFSWGSPGGSVVNYTLWRWTGGACSGTSTATSVGTGTSNTQSTLSSATSYSVEVAAWSSGGMGALSSCVTGTTLPTAPTSMTVTAVTTSSVTATWANPSGTLVNDTIYIWTASSCTGSYSTASLGVATTANPGGLASATTYSLEAGAWSASGQAVSSCVQGTTLPLAITGFSATSTTSSTVVLGWTNPSGTLANLTLYWGTSCSALVPYGNAPITGGSLGVVTTFTATSAAAAQTYCFKLWAWSAGGAGVAVFTNGSTLPTTPTGLTFTLVTSTGFTASWTNSLGNLVNVTIQIGTTCAGAHSSLGVVTSDAFTGLSPGRTYCVGVQDWSAGGGSGWVYGNQTLAASPPKAPTGLKVTSLSSSTVSLLWNAPPGTVLASDVFYGLRCDAQPWLQAVSSGNSTTVGNLAPSTTYCFSVAAVNASGAGPSSSSVVATTSGSGGGGGSAPTPGTGGGAAPTPIPSSPTFQFISLTLPIAGVLLIVGGVTETVLTSRWRRLPGVIAFLVGLGLVIL